MPRRDEKKSAGFGRIASRKIFVSTRSSTHSRLLGLGVFSAIDTQNGAGIVYILKYCGFYEVVYVVPWLGASFAKSCGHPASFVTSRKDAHVLGNEPEYLTRALLLLEGQPHTQRDEHHACDSLQDVTDVGAKTAFPSPTDERAIEVEPAQ